MSLGDIALGGRAQPLHRGEARSAHAAHVERLDAKALQRKRGRLGHPRARFI